jgi:DNA-binding Xre family transcriptional regulator
MVRLKVREVAESQGYNMSSLSRATDMSFNTIKRLWKHPEQGTNVQTLDKIASVLNCSVSDLIENVPDDKNSW